MAPTRPKRSAVSAGVLAWRRIGGALEVLLVHPGGPYWAKKDLGAWSIPKGEPNPGEDMLTAARREFGEEIGQAIDGDFTPLAPVRQKGGKTVHAFAITRDLDVSRVVSIEFEMEWPPRSGRLQRFPEVDRAAWFALTEARERIIPGQAPMLDELEKFVFSGRLDPGSRPG